MVRKAKASAHGKRSRKEEPEHTQETMAIFDPERPSKGYIAGTTFGLKEIVYTSMNGQAIFEGDIVLGSDQEMEEVKERVEHPPADLMSRDGGSRRGRRAVPHAGYISCHGIAKNARGRRPRAYRPRSSGRSIHG